jgi:chromatin structure-remodeling complex subunit RSC9
MNEVCLVIRNMSMLEENARYLSEQYQFRDFLSIAFNLPRLNCLVELKHYCLDMAEQVTKYWSLGSLDPLYRSLLDVLEDGTDRGASLTCLRAISRIAMNLDDSNRLEGVSVSIITRLFNWTLLDDEELVAACLDFFYQYTAVRENVEFLLVNMRDGKLCLNAFLSQLGRLLLYNHHESIQRRVSSPAVPSKPTTEIASMPSELLQQLLSYSEPDRSSHWLRSCFDEDQDFSITQIALWQAYQYQFTQYSSPTNPLLAAAEFIKNVSTTFPTANAQVIAGPNPKFIIKGIRARQVPIDLKGRTYMRCLWKPPGSKLCGKFHLTALETWEHIVKEHLGMSKPANGSWDLSAPQNGVTETPKFDCHWAGCQHFARAGGADAPYQVGMHVQTHLPDHSDMAPHRAKFNRSNAKAAISDNDIPDDHNLNGRPATYDYFVWYNTAVDERGDAAGLPLTSVLVLRNLARNVPKAVIGLQSSEDEPAWASGAHVWMDRVFGPLHARLWHIMAHNRSLATYVWDLISAIEKGKEA